MTKEERAALIANYNKKSQEEGVQYSPLQWAAYEGNISAIQVLIDEYKESASLAHALRYSQGAFGENILHIAIKHPKVLALCRDALKSCHLFEEMLTQPDKDGDRVMHQIVIFGRKQSLELLASDYEIHPLLLESMQEPNQHSETVFDLVNHFDSSKTNAELTTKGVLDAAQLSVTRKNLTSIEAIVTELAHQMPAPRI